MKRTLLICFLVFISINILSAQEGITRTLYVADQKTACLYNDAVTSCLRVKNHIDSAWIEFPFEIEGFIFEPGMECLLEIMETPIKYPEDNGPKYTYKLISIISKKSTVIDDKRILAANKWKIINIQEDRNIIPSKKANGFLIFDLDSNRINGFGGCNGFGGNVSVENGIIQAGLLNTTLLSCEFDAIEKKILDGLNGKSAFYVRNNMLFIVCENHTVLHLRPEKRIDSIINLINKPVVPYKGNIFSDLKTGHYSVNLDELLESKQESMLFKKETLSTLEKRINKIKMININPDSDIVRIYILLKPHKKKGMYYATVVMKDGSKKSVVIKNVP